MESLGKTKHIQTGLLWTHQPATDQRFRYANVLGKHNLADLYTKLFDIATADAHVHKLEYINDSNWKSIAATWLSTIKLAHESAL